MQRAALVLLATMLLAGVAGAATITGTARADRLTGTPRADRIDGRAGNDRLLGLGGADLLIGGPGRDRIEGGRGDDSVPAHGDETRDTIVCGPGRDVVTADVTDVVGKDCEVVSRQISRDGTTDPTGQHATEVEPDSFAFGSTIVSAFQVGRVSEGGSVAIGFATSVNSGSTWQSGLLPGVTRSSPRPGVAERASDPVVAYDSEHDTWLAVTLVISPATGSYHLDVNRSPDGLSWTAPIHAVTGGDGDLDKEWASCDNGATSPFRGRCYISYYDIPSGELRTTHSDDGGTTWTAPVASTPRPPRGYDFNGAQPLIQPSGAVVLVYTAFADPTTGARSEIQATTSTDGGTTWSAPTQVAAFELGTITGIRTFALTSAEADASGRMYVAWEGCRAGTPCGSRRILLSTSVDGVSWTPATTITSGAAAVSHFLPGLGVDPTANGRLTLVYHAIPNGCVDSARCPGIDVFTRSSGDGGASWSAPQRLTAEPIALDWIAHTRLGLMLADYVSTSYVRGTPVSVFVLAAQRSGTRFRQSVFAHRS